MTNANKPLDNITHKEIPRPPVANNPESLPSAVTFFVNHAQRKQILSILKSYSHDRSVALDIVLSLAERETRSMPNGVQIHD
ncbi:MAG: hypothetical protein P1U42_07010 [Phycisphaerales bacterium]|nr:hypothetical protein [Phycisphaerales bacterium]